MSKKRNITDDPLFILKGERGEIIIVDDPAMVARLDTKVAEMEAQGFDEMAITQVLLRLIEDEGREVL